eukprot:gene34000-43929_t
MAIVGALIWISGLRLDILFSTMYLACSSLPLVLGGGPTIAIHGYSDASLGTGPKGRSIVSNLVKLSPEAGAITAKVTANQSVVTSSFEAELDGVTRGVAKGLRHMELRMWYVREKYKEGTYVLDYMAGTIIPADKLTKLGTKAEHIEFTKDIMGHKLLE